MLSILLAMTSIVWAKPTSITLNVEMLFSDSTTAYQIKVLDRERDSFIVALDLNSKDTLRMPAMLYLEKRHGFDTSSRWVSTFPRIGEELIALKLNKNGWLYARSYGRYYRFWCPEGMYYAVRFEMLKRGIFKPIKICRQKEHGLDLDTWTCHGFLMPVDALKSFLEECRKRE